MLLQSVGLYTAVQGVAFDVIYACVCVCVRTSQSYQLDGACQHKHPLQRSQEIINTAKKDMYTVVSEQLTSCIVMRQ